MPANALYYKYMQMAQFIYLYLATIPVFLIVDLLWLGIVTRGFYRSQLREFLGPVKWPVALIFYFLYVLGIVFFAVLPALAIESFARAALLGALLGFFAYMTYDLTNYSTLRNWPPALTVVDIIWGTVLTTVVASASYFIGIHFFF